MVTILGTFVAYWAALAVHPQSHLIERVVILYYRSNLMSTDRTEIKLLTFSSNRDMIGLSIKQGVKNVKTQNN